MSGVYLPPLIPFCLMRRIAMAVATVLLTASTFAAPLDPLLQNAQLWQLDQATFGATGAAHGYRWTSEAKDSARASRELTFLGIPAVESVARFNNQKLAELVVTFYARGDAGDWPQEKFQASLKTIIDALNAHTKAKMTVRGKDATSAVKAEGLIWETPGAQYLLEYSFTKKMRDIPFRAEFIRLEVRPPSRPTSLLAGASSSASKTKFDGETRVKKDAASGDVYIEDVPMVDQGEKGYCAVACAERVMRYYGVAVDANELAQVANTETTGGTSAREMFDALKKLSARLRVRVRPMEELEVKALKDLINDYNRAAKRGDRAPLIPDMGSMIDVGAMYRAMRVDILKEVRTKNKGDMNRFQRDIQTNIDQGVPVIWSVMLGMVKEPGIPQSAGGHMRLIIGYNNKTQEILFSDSWGAGHELKRMPIDDAWTITTGLTKIEPFS